MLLQDRLLDVATYMTAVPASQIVEVETSIPMHVLELDPDVMERFRAEHPEYQKYVKSTPILLPFVPLYSVEKYKFLVA